MPVGTGRGESSRRAGVDSPFALGRLPAETLDERKQLASVFNEWRGSLEATKWPRCLPGNTPVYRAEDAWPIPIKDIRVGDSILVPGGTGKVSAKFVYDADTVVTLKARGLVPLESTPEHKHLVVRRGAVEWNGRRHRVQANQVRRSVGSFENPISVDAVEHVQAKDIEEGDYLVVGASRPRVYEKIELEVPAYGGRGRKRRPIPKTIPITPDFLRLAGLFLADGCASVEGGFLSFGYGIDEGALADETVALLERLFGVPASKRRVKTKKTALNSKPQGYNQWEVKASNVTLAENFKRLFGGGGKATAEKAETPKRIPKELWGAKESLLPLARGMADGDGYSKRETFAFMQSTPHLVQQIHAALLAEGQPASMACYRDGSDLGGTGESWVLRVLQCGDRGPAWLGLEDGSFAVRIHGVSQRAYTGKVYDIEMSTPEHVYIAGAHYHTHNSLSYFENVSYLLGNTLTRFYYCLPPGTPVYRSSGEVVAIENVKRGDEILTQEGPSRVAKTHAMRADELVEVTASGVDPMEATPNHPFLLIPREDIHFPSKPRRRGKSGRSLGVAEQPFPADRAKKVKAEDIRVGDYVVQGFTRPRVTEKLHLTQPVDLNRVYVRHGEISEPASVGRPREAGRQAGLDFLKGWWGDRESATADEILEAARARGLELSGGQWRRARRDFGLVRLGEGVCGGRPVKPVPPVIELTPDLLFVFGLYLGDGSCTGTEIGFSFARDEQHLVDCVRQVMAEVFGLEATCRVEGNVLRAEVFSKPLAQNFQKWLGGGGLPKRVCPEVFSSKQSLVPLLDGVEQADGLGSRDRGFGGANRELLLQLRGIALAEGVYAGFRSRLRKPDPRTGKRYWSADVRRGCTHRAMNRVLVLDNGLYAVMVTKTKRRSYSGVVYDLTMDNDSHTFLAGAHYSVSNTGDGGLGFQNLVREGSDFDNLVAKCFPAGTPVYGEDGWVRPIEEVDVGDRILAADGPVDVISRFVYPASRLTRVTLRGCFPLESTPDHKHLVIPMGAVTYPGCGQRRQVKRVQVGKSATPVPAATARKVRAADIQTGDYVVVGSWRPRTTEKLELLDTERAGETGRPCKPLPQYVELTPDFLRYIGLYLGDGNADVGSGSLRFSFGRNEEDLVRWVQAFTCRVFGLDSVVSLDGNMWVVHVYSRPLAKNFKRLFGGGGVTTEEKRLQPKRIPAEVFSARGSLLPLVEGLLAADGNGSDGCRSLVQADERLVAQVRGVLLAEGQYASVNHRRGTGFGKPSRYAVLCWHKQESSPALFLDDGTFAVKVERVEEEERACEVYDLEVNNPSHTYVAGCQVVTSNSADNKLIRPVETVVNMLTSSRPQIRVERNTDLPEDSDAATVAETLIQLLWEKPLYMPDVLNEVAFGACINSTQAVEIEYGPTDVLEEVPKIRTEKRLNPLFVSEEETPEEPREVEVEVVSDEIEVSNKRDFKARNWNFFHLTHDPTATKPSELAWVARSSFEDVEWVVENFAIEGDERYTYSDPDELRYNIPTNNATKFTLYWWQRFKDIIESPQYYQHGAGLSPRTWELAGGEAPGQTLFDVVDVKPTRQYPRGRTLILAGGTLIYAGEARAWSQEYPWRWHPYAFFGWLKVPGRFDHIPLLSELVPLQKKINAIDALTHANRQYMSIGQWKIPTISKIAEGRLTGIPGFHIFYKATPGYPVPERVVHTPLPHELLVERDQLIRSIDYIAGTGLVGDDIAKSAARAGVILDVLRREKAEAKGPMLASFERFLEVIGQNILIEAQLNLRDEDPELTRRLQVALRDQADVVLDAFTGGSLRDHHSVKIDVSSELRHSPELLGQRAMEWFQATAGNVTPEEREGFFKATGLDRFVKNLESATVRRVQRVITQVERGNMGAAFVMQGVDDPVAASMTLQRYLLTERAMDLSRDSKDAYEAIVNLFGEYQALVQQRQQQQLQLQLAMAQAGGKQQTQSEPEAGASEPTGA